LGSNFDFFPVNGNYPIGANDSTIGAAGTFVGIGCVSKPVTFVVYLPGNGDYFGRAGAHANFATFAAFNIDNYYSSDFSHLVKDLNFR
jgi:hypothetical protein